jgi:hypothetical protein
MPRGTTRYDETVLQKRLWTPDAVGLPMNVWYDADDAGTIVLNGFTVSQWNDKSGNGRNASQATTANQPTYKALGWQGRRAEITFDGSNDSLTFLSATISQPFEMWAVINLPVDATADADLWGSSSPLLHCRPNWSLGNVTLDYAGGTNLQAPRLTAGTYMWGVGYNAGSSFDRLNGAQRATANAGNNGLGANSLIGKQVNGNNWLNVEIAELLITSGFLDNIRRQTLEGYFAWKWGLETTLAADHPFVLRPPTIGD